MMPETAQGEAPIADVKTGEFQETLIEATTNAAPAAPADVEQTASRSETKTARTPAQEAEAEADPTTVAALAANAQVIVTAQPSDGVDPKTSVSTEPKQKKGEESLEKAEPAVPENASLIDPKLTAPVLTSPATNPVRKSQPVDPVLTNGTTNPVQKTLAADPVLTSPTTSPVRKSWPVDPVLTSATTNPVQKTLVADSVLTSSTTGPVTTPSRTRPVSPEDAAPKTEPWQKGSTTNELPASAGTAEASEGGAKSPKVEMRVVNDGTPVSMTPSKRTVPVSIPNDDATTSPVTSPIAAPVPPRHGRVDQPRRTRVEAISNPEATTNEFYINHENKSASSASVGKSSPNPTEPAVLLAEATATTPVLESQVCGHGNAAPTQSLETQGTEVSAIRDAAAAAENVLEEVQFVVPAQPISVNPEDEVEGPVVGVQAPPALAARVAIAGTPTTAVSEKRITSSAQYTDAVAEVLWMSGRIAPPVATNEVGSKEKVVAVAVAPTVNDAKEIQQPAGDAPKRETPETAFPIIDHEAAPVVNEKSSRPKASADDLRTPADPEPAPGGVMVQPVQPSPISVDRNREWKQPVSKEQEREHSAAANVAEGQAPDRHVAAEKSDLSVATAATADSFPVAAVPRMESAVAAIPAMVTDNKVLENATAMPQSEPVIRNTEVASTVAHERHTYMPGINTAKLVQRMNESEMRVGLHSEDLGRISVRTSLVHEQLTAEISVERSVLSKALTEQLPALQSKLGEEYGVNTRIEIQDRSAGFSGESQYQQQRSQRQYSWEPATPNLGTAVESFHKASVAPALLTPSETRLDIRI